VSRAPRASDSSIAGASFAAQFRAGALAILPLVVAAIPFGVIFGAEASRRGLSPADASLMSATVFAGGAQFLAVGLWRHPAPWAGLAFAVLLINLRHVLMGASLVPKMEAFAGWRRWLAAFILTDELWATAERRALVQPLTPAFYAGAGVSMYAVWQTATALGALIGGFVPKPEIYGLDFAFPATFLCIVMGFAKSWRAAPVIAVSAAAALTAHAFLGGTWYVIAGGLAGMAAAVAVPSPPRGAKTA
jgi:4-azaleucine resistance transporter AzlC